jgi:hypothetical protein
MAVYVDDWRQLATVRNMTARWSHMTADTESELHEFAEKLGIPRRAFQHKPGKPQFDHYDIPEELRAKAMELGAVSLEWREAARLRKKKKADKSGSL